MDAFPDYTKFDKQHKVFAAIQIIGDENIHPDTVSEEGGAKKELDPKLDEVVGGGDWIKTATLTDGGRKLSTLGNNFSATMDGTDIDLFGNLNRIDNWKEYSSNPNDLTGYYYPFELKAKDGVKFIRRIPSTGEDKTLVFGQTNDPAGTMRVVFAVNPDSPTILATLEDSDGKRTDYTFDFCKVVFK